MTENQQNKILLHACCGICSGRPIEQLIELGYEPIVYFYNPNIQPKEEYLKRLEAQEKVCGHFGCEIIVETYDESEFEEIAIGLESEPEGGARCPKCFELRLNKTAKKAREIGVGIFTTSIVISPHKKYDLITALGKNIANLYGIKYLDINFKKQDGFLKTNKISRDLNLYRQNYCGCRFSKHK